MGGTGWLNRNWHVYFARVPNAVTKRTSVMGRLALADRGPKELHISIKSWRHFAGLKLALQPQMRYILETRADVVVQEGACHNHLNP